MFHVKSIAAATGLLIAALSTAAQAQMCQNTCMADVTGPRQGRHSADESADAVLWPPNHKFRAITISASNTNGKDCDVTISDVAQDEPVDGIGSGGSRHSPDAANCSNAGNSSSVDLRGERAGTNGEEEGGMGTGRYYHASYLMEDPDCAEPKIDTAVVLVPHDQGKSHIGTWVDEGPLFASDGSTDGSIACPE